MNEKERKEGRNRMSNEQRPEDWKSSGEKMTREDDDFLFENQNMTPEEDAYDPFAFEDTERLEAYLSDAVAKVTEEKKEDSMNNNDMFEIKGTNRIWSMKKRIFVGLGTFVGCAIFALTLVFGWGMFRITKEQGGVYAATDLTAEELAAQETLPPRDGDQVLLDDQVINILLIGREGIHDGNGNGRSDSMIIASLNTEEKTIKMVSVMRDCYVSIPGYKSNKLNAAYSFGGGELLCATIEQNFGVLLDGYVVVDFAGFKKMIDKIGGVEIELTESEAQYLNTTNYISDKSQRNVVPGKQTVTGTQALGYCRVRKRAAINGENDDYGRTYRQRAVLTQVYEKVKKLNIAQALGLANTLLGYVTTNIDRNDIMDYATAVIQLGIPEIETMRIPVNGGYSGQNLWCGSSLVLDSDQNKDAILNFIYGDEHGEITTINPDTVGISNSTNTNINTNTSSSSSQTTIVTKAPVSQVKITKAPVVTKAPATQSGEEEEVITVEPVETSASEVTVTKAPEVTVTEAPQVTVTKAPAVEQPAAEQPAAEQPAAEQPAGDQSAAGQSDAGQPAAEPPAGEQPAAEQPAGDGSVG